MSNNIQGPGGGYSFDPAFADTVAPNLQIQDSGGIGGIPISDLQGGRFLEICEQAAQEIAKAFEPPKTYLEQTLGIFGQEHMSYADLNGSPYAFLDLGAAASGGTGNVHMFTIGEGQYAVIDITVPESGKRLVGVYQSANSPVPQWLHESGEHNVLLGDGGRLHVDWYDTIDADGNVVPGNKIKVSYTPPEMVQTSTAPAAVPAGMAQVGSECSGALLSSGDRIPLPAESLAETIVRVGNEEYLVVSDNGKVAHWNDHEGGEASRLHNRPKIFYNSLDRLSVPAAELPFGISPDGGLYFLDLENMNAVDRLILEEIAKYETVKFRPAEAASPVAADHGMARLSNIDTFGESRSSSPLLYDPTAKPHGNGPFYYVQDAAEFGRLSSQSQLHLAGQATLVSDATGGLSDVHAAADGHVVILRETTGSPGIGQYFGDGTFNVVGGAMVVVGSEMLGEMRGEPLSGEEEAAFGIGTFYGLAAWMEAASAGGVQSVDWALFNSNFARATPVAAAGGVPIFYGASQLVEETGVDPASFEGSLATTTIGGAGLALTLQAELPALLTVGSYSTGASLMTGAAVTEVGLATASGIVLVEGALVLGSGYAGYKIGQASDEPVGMLIYRVDECLTNPVAAEVSDISPAAGEAIDNFTDVGQDGDVSLSGWLAADWTHPAAVATVTLGPVAGLYVYLGDKLYKHFTVAHASEQ